MLHFKHHNMACRYQQCHCLAALSAKMSVFSDHMQGSHSVTSQETRIAHQKGHIRTKKSRRLLVRTQTYECACLNRNDNRMLNYSSSSKFSSAARTLTSGRLFCCSRRFSYSWQPTPLMTYLTNCWNTFVIQLEILYNIEVQLDLKSHKNIIPMLCSSN